MRDIAFTDEAVQHLKKASNDLRFRPNNIPLIGRATKTTIRRNDGTETVLGPRLYLSSHDAEKTENVVILDLAHNLRIALMPVKFFGSGEHKIDFRDGEFHLSNDPAGTHD
jgi:hypothetical protein